MGTAYLETRNIKEPSLRLVRLGTAAGTWALELGCLNLRTVCMASGYLSMFLNLGLEYFPGEVG
jgi:hypothetical protein